jgi:hypothetical protein
MSRTPTLQDSNKASSRGRRRAQLRRHVSHKQVNRSCVLLDCVEAYSL